MKLWMTSEADKAMTRILSKLDIPIEDQFNAYLEEIGYKNDQIDELWQIIVIRDDEFRGTQGGEKIEKARGKKEYGRSPRIDYHTFKNADENERKRLIWKTILESLEQLEQRGIKNLEIPKEYVRKQIEALG